MAGKVPNAACTASVRLCAAGSGAESSRLSEGEVPASEASDGDECNGAKVTGSAAERSASLAVEKLWRRDSVISLSEATPVSVGGRKGRCRATGGGAASDRSDAELLGAPVSKSPRDYVAHRSTTVRP